VSDRNECPACRARLEQKIADWLACCPTCGLWLSRFGPEPREGHGENALQEDLREIGLKPLRVRNFELTLAALDAAGPVRGARLLDVGCAHGWFLEAAKARGLRVVGVEPDAEVARKSIENGSDVRVGYFPDCIPVAERFDVIAFNDVLEHLPDLDQILAACHERLAPRGRLVINLPDADGLLYRTACLAARLGWKPSLERLWQKNFRFPHLYYFNARTLGRVVTPFGFRLLHTQGLPMLRLQGLWSRLRMDKTASLAGAVVVYAFIVLTYPLFAFVAQDALLQVYERGDG
jgi:2-polyprenyl-3-methyl-5-hydroxy-6-metoxy-1,4-benzoquinol methylase